MLLIKSKNLILSSYCRLKTKMRLEFQVVQGWKPGAITKRLLRKLNAAKFQEKTIEIMKPSQKPKKRTGEKATLMITKKNGEYRVEMQASPKNGEGNAEKFKPLIYKIAAANNKHRLRKKEKIQRHLIEQAVQDVWFDPYHPEICEKTCLKAYKQAMGLLPFDPNNPECFCSGEEETKHSLCTYSCDDEDIGSDCESLDVDWEIYFSPPIASHL